MATGTGEGRPMRFGKRSSRIPAGSTSEFRRLSFLNRTFIGHRVLWRLLQTRLFWRITFLYLCLSAVMQIIAWRNDLWGLQRDLLLCLPALLCVPFVAVARYRGIARILQENKGRQRTDQP